MSTAIEQVEKALDRFEPHPIKVVGNLCSAKRHRLSNCKRCVDACPAGALTLRTTAAIGGPGSAVADGPHIDPERCTGCGMCAAVCPAGALEAQSPSNIELLAQVMRLALAGQGVAFACPLSLEQADAGRPCVIVNCLGRLDESLLVGAVAHGARPVRLIDRACEGCAQAAGRAMAAAAIERSNGLLAAFGLPGQIAFHTGKACALPAPTPAAGNGEGLSRRGLLKRLAQETLRAGQAIAEAPQPGESQPRELLPADEPLPRGELPADLPLTRALLLTALRRLDPAPLAGPGQAAAGAGLFASFDCTDQCTGCQMCGFFCPTGALTKVEQDGQLGVIFRPARCTDCGLCRDICYRDAVVLSSGADLTYVLADAAQVFLMRDADAAPWLKLASKQTGGYWVLPAKPGEWAP
ncbi:MAG: 4Fe-4S binding protein [Anaerolineaceae bacterium]|nr:4Fe-4S binding protein [Anaerolineaceae bacterium]